MKTAPGSCEAAEEPQADSWSGTELSAAGAGLSLLQ